jgi:hypothetical protein
VRLLLRHPFLASSSKQLLHLSGLVHDLPSAVGIGKAELQAVLAQQPGLAHYTSTAALASKIKALSSLFPGGVGVLAVKATSWLRAISTAKLHVDATLSQLWRNHSAHLASLVPVGRQPMGVSLKLALPALHVALRHSAR